VDAIWLRRWQRLLLIASVCSLAALLTAMLIPLLTWWYVRFWPYVTLLVVVLALATYVLAKSERDDWEWSAMVTSIAWLLLWRALIVDAEWGSTVCIIPSLGAIGVMTIIALRFAGVHFAPRSQSDPHRCAKCGYCLIGSVSDRCPECGAPHSVPPLPEERQSEATRE